jgi:peroxiredoxin Q/BCP
MLFGKDVLGTSRDTFLINPEGLITDVWRKVSPKGHPEAVKSVLMKRKENMK